MIGYLIFNLKTVERILTRFVAISFKKVQTVSLLSNRRWRCPDVKLRSMISGLNPDLGETH